MNVDALRNAHDTLLAAATTVSGADGTLSPPDGEWDADRILAHVSRIDGVTLGAVSAVASGVNTTYDNRIALDTWTIDRLVTVAGGRDGLCARIRRQGEALVGLGGTMSAPELATPIPTRLLSHGDVLVDTVLSLADLLGGLADGELPAHTRQLLSLLPPAHPDRPG